MSRFSVALLAHGDDDTRRRLAMQVEHAGAEVQHTADGLQALEIVRLAPPQLAYVGPAVGGMLPLDLCKALANKGIPVVFLGGDGISRDEAIKSGAVDYLPLPEFVDEAGVVGKLLVTRERDASSGDWVVRSMLSEFGCHGLVRALCALGRSAILTLERGDRTGEVRICDGEVTSVQLGTTTGIAALHRLLLWQEAMFELRFATVVKRQQIGLTQAELLAEIDRFLRDCAHAAKQLGSTKAIYEQDVQRAAHVLTRIPSEVEGLVRLFDGARTVADVIQDSPFRPFDTIRVTGRLVEMGALKRVVRGGSASGRTAAKKKKGTPIPKTDAVGKWLTTPPRGTRRSPTRPPVTVVTEPPPVEHVNTQPMTRIDPVDTQPMPLIAEPVPVPRVATPAPEAVVLTPKPVTPEVSLERRIEEALARQAPQPPPPAPDREGLQVIAKGPSVNLFGTAPPVWPPAPPVVAQPIPPPVEAAPPPPPIAVTPPPIPAEVAPPPPPPIAATPPPIPAEVAPPPIAATPPPSPAEVAPPPPPIAATPASPPAPVAPPQPVHAAPRPPSRPPKPGMPAFSDLEEEFFSKVDEHGQLPQAVDTFDDLVDPADIKLK